jgi:hypothetical protein
MSTRRIGNPWWLALAGITLAGVVCVAWGFAVYVHLVQLQVRVADARSRVEAAGRSRVELAANLIQGSVDFHCLEADRLALLRVATDGAGRALIAPRILDEVEPYPEFLVAQDRLSSALKGTWPVVRRSREAGARILVEDLESRLEQASLLLADGLGQLDRSLEAYRSETSRFPGSLIAGVAWRGGRTVAVARGPADVRRAGP